MTGQQENKESEFVLVPRKPTPAMIKAGWYEAHDECAAGAWRDMIEAWELEQLSLQQGEVSQR